jgi:cellobiose-specific phosphotransferase system component IIB
MQYLVFQDEPKITSVIVNNIYKNIKSTYVKYNPSISILKNKSLKLQIEDLIDEAIDLLVSNDILAKKYPKVDISLSSNQIKIYSNPLYSLTTKAKIHIQAEEPVKFIGINGEILYILDFLP